MRLALRPRAGIALALVAALAVTLSPPGRRAPSDLGVQVGGDLSLPAVVRMIGFGGEYDVRWTLE